MGRLPRPALLLAAIGAGCLGRPIGLGDGNASGGSSGDGGVTTATTTGTTGATTRDDLPGTESDTTTDSGCGSFIGCADFGDGGDCDTFAQDCPASEKCMPWANDGGNSWNATRCSPVAEDPAQLDEPCLVEGSGVSGIDDCDLGLMCWDVDPETNMGSCIGLCSGTPDEPVCPPDARCAVTNAGVLALCLTPCDPVQQDCPDGQQCFPTRQGATCGPGQGGDAMLGEPCEFLNACAPGLLCANAPSVPGCLGSQGCCTPYCDLTAPNCVAPTRCQPLFEGPPPPGFEDVGACALP